MAWSAENATNAYLRTLKSGKKGMEPDVAEFISALAAGSGARLMVEACCDAAGPTTIALAAAAHQTGGRAVCVVVGGSHAAGEVAGVEVVSGDARGLLAGELRTADFVLVDCGLEEQEAVFRSAAENCVGLVVGYNAFKGRPWSVGGRDLRVDLLPIGGGLRVCRVAKRKSRWVVRVDEGTGEEHVFRIAPPRRKEIKA